MRMPEWMKDIIRVIVASGGVLALIEWVRHRKKDTASVGKVNAETQIDLAEVTNKKIDDEVKISKAALEWTVQLASQLEKANILNEKRQLEIDRLHSIIQQTKDDFDKRMKEMEDMLQANQHELDIERKTNRDLLDKLNRAINGTGK